MSVHTSLTQAEAESFLSRYQIGDLRQFEGLKEGITNSNYLVETSMGRYVLTIIEDMGIDDMPFFIELLSFLFANGIQCPNPLTDDQGVALRILKNKPAILVPFLPGDMVSEPTVEQCRSVGMALSDLHLKTNAYPKKFPNRCGLKWREALASKLYPVLDKEDAALLKDEIDFHASYDIKKLPQGIIHADLFRDNVLFEADELTGLIDFYYACNDALILDVAIVANDWCFNDEEKTQALLKGYQENRLFTEKEKQLWPTMLRLAALRFWLSRLYDTHFPARGEMVKVKAPGEFKKILLKHRGY